METQPVTTITFSRKSIRIAEQYFTDSVSEDSVKADLVRFIGLLRTNNNNESSNSHTLIIDLTEDSETLLKQMNEATRNQIRRAERKDKITCHAISPVSLSEIDAFCDYYDEFAKSKNLRPVFRPRLYELAKKNMLALSFAADTEGNTR
jgi:hypothetical protein